MQSNRTLSRLIASGADLWARSSFGMMSRELRRGVIRVMRVILKVMPHVNATVGIVH
jgi:hypothetical protein